MHFTGAEEKRSIGYDDGDDDDAQKIICSRCIRLLK
jgi:hypothetical protein